MEKSNNFFESFFEYVRNHPSLAGYLIAGIGILLLLGVIMDANWMLEGGNGFFNIATISKMFGRKTARILMGGLSAIIILAGLFIGFSN